jgi:hypothetical protein
VLTFLSYPPWVALAYGAGGLLIAWRVLPRAKQDATLPRIPRVELALRLTVAFALAAFILWGSAHFGPVVSGILLSMPITGSIIPPFTLKLHGADAMARVVRGFVTGLTGFTAFFFVVAIAIVALGTAAGFSLAVGAALITVAAASHFGRRLALGDD